MKKIFTISLVMLCATMLSAQVTIRFKAVPGGWDKINIYSWQTIGGSNVEIFGAWPGATSEKDANGFYSVTVPAGKSVGNVIFNNGSGAQFDATNVTDAVLPACFSISATTATLLEDCAGAIPPPPPADVVLRFKQVGDNNWEKVYIYSWDDRSGSNVEIWGGWPGATSTKDANGWYTVEVPNGKSVGNVIFNNNAGAQFDAFAVENAPTVSTCYEITTSAATVVTCPVVGTYDVAADGSTVVGYFSILGAKLSQEPASGLFLVKYSNGKTVKVVK